MIDPIFAFAALLAFVGAMAGFVGALRHLAAKYSRTIRHRMFDRVRPSRWPKVDYRVGKDCRPRDFE